MIFKSKIIKIRDITKRMLMTEKDNKVINSESLFRLLTCKHCNVGSSENLNNPTLKCSKFLNRDMNSCVNMQCIVKAYLTENRKRPQEFTRT